jgi:hypothetical protein
MKKLIVKIAEHTVEVLSSSDPLLNWIQTYYQMAKALNLSVDLSICIQDGYGIPFTNYDVQITTNSDFISYKRADYFIKVDKNYREAVISVHNEFALKHALTNLYSAFIVHHQWGLLIHSSCVEQNGKAYLFAGQSGAGKSTVAQVSTPRPLLSDEASILKINENEVKVFDSPFRSELISSYDPGTCELAGIYLLNQSLDVRTSLIKKSDAMLDIINKIFHWHRDSNETAKLLNMCKHLVDQVPVYNLYFQKNNTFWELIS